jgi:hypothetical protein
MTDIINKADKYAEWIVNNPDKKGTDEFNTVAQAYQEAKSQNVSAQNGNDYVPSAANIEKPVAVNQPERSLTNKALDFLAQKATLGGAKTWDQNLFSDGSVTPQNANEPTTWEYTKALGEKALENSNALAGIGPIGQIAPMSTKAGRLLLMLLKLFQLLLLKHFLMLQKWLLKLQLQLKILLQIF